MNLDRNMTLSCYGWDRPVAWRTEGFEQSAETDSVLEAASVTVGALVAVEVEEGYDYCCCYSLRRVELVVQASMKLELEGLLCDWTMVLNPILQTVLEVDLLFHKQLFKIVSTSFSSLSSL